MSENVIQQQSAEPTRQARILQMAREQWATPGEIEIDDDAEIKEGDNNGTFVRAWVWVDFGGTDLNKEQDQDEDDAHERAHEAGSATLQHRQDCQECSPA